MTNEHNPAPNLPEVLTGETVQAEDTPEPSLCGTCIHQPYCACRGKTGYCGNYIHMATRVLGGRFDPLRFNT